MAFLFPDIKRPWRGTHLVQSLPHQYQEEVVARERKIPRAPDVDRVAGDPKAFLLKCCRARVVLLSSRRQDYSFFSAG